MFYFKLVNCDFTDKKIINCSKNLIIKEKCVYFACLKTSLYHLSFIKMVELISVYKLSNS